MMFIKEAASKIQKMLSTLSIEDVNRWVRSGAEGGVRSKSTLAIGQSKGLQELYRKRGIKVNHIEGGALGSHADAGGIHISPSSNKKDRLLKNLIKFHEVDEFAALSKGVEKSPFVTANPGSIDYAISAMKSDKIQTRTRAVRNAYFNAKLTGASQDDLKRAVSKAKSDSKKSMHHLHNGSGQAFLGSASMSHLSTRVLTNEARNINNIGIHAQFNKSGLGRMFKKSRIDEYSAIGIDRPITTRAESVAASKVKPYAEYSGTKFYGNTYGGQFGGNELKTYIGSSIPARMSHNNIVRNTAFYKKIDYPNLSAIIDKHYNKRLVKEV